MEFHIARRVRERYRFDDSLFSTRGNVIFADFHAARVFAQRMNEQRDTARYPELTVAPGQINAMGLIDEILHIVVARYREQHPDVVDRALTTLGSQLGTDDVDGTLLVFAKAFPNTALFRGEVEPDEYLAGSTDGIPNREVLLEELLMLWLSNNNPAYQPFRELFDDAELEGTAYSEVIAGLQTFFEGEPGFGGESESLIMTLRSPALKTPHSLAAQLEYLLQRIGGVLGSLLFRLLTSLDLIKEEDKFFAAGGAGGVAGGPGPIEVADFRGQEHEKEAFTVDREWMPRTVLIARNAFVWLDQLAKRYQRPINTLDQIPDEELDFLQRAGITGLWLIGLWERSTASKTIKQLMGNQDAVASAYSLYDYVIANDLGGEAAVDNLRGRCRQRGIRLASDMVPNHVGIDGRWVIEHPDWFLSLPYPPYPSYTFNGPDLSQDGRVGIFIEDHYYTKSDAAVVFKRVGRESGDERYIYHGNDGTSMPWNDTAQIDYLNPEAREAVIRTILHVARQFPIIRFDAAMTLAKKHIQRLWFPEPGSGGAIPSRAEHGITKAQFDALMPHEFWREVVDRCAVEAPDTLLLAEAFWLMEGYFVRTLGMHRVYNSAFMHMLRDEDNAKYRLAIRNTLEFDPQILQRYVNFMNNPDEKTAVEQFGKDDKYFGVCTVMATLPGLPMFGHGQFEGFAEKYGMEYRRAYWDEQPDSWLIGRHERQIFPLLHKRYLFAGAENFLLYDCVAPDGHVDENVYAYSNQYGDERGLVVYNNRYGSARGTIRTGFTTVRDGNGRRAVHRSLGEALGLSGDERGFLLFRDVSSGLEYIRSSREIAERGMYIELDAYGLNVLLDIREVRDTPWGQWSQLNSHLNGRGVPSLDQAARELLLRPIHEPFRALVNGYVVREVMAVRAADRVKSTKPPTGSTAAPATTPGGSTAAPAEKDTANAGNGAEQAGDRSAPRAREQVLDDVQRRLEAFFAGVRQVNGGGADAAPLAEQLRGELEALLELPALVRRVRRQGATAAAGDGEVAAAVAFVTTHLGDDPDTWGALLSWLFTHRLDRLNGKDDPGLSRSLIDEWLLGSQLAAAMRELGQDEGRAWRTVGLVKLLIGYGDALRLQANNGSGAAHTLAGWLRDGDMQRFLQVNRYRDVLWFNQESLDQLLAWLLAIEAAEQLAGGADTDDVTAGLAERYVYVQQLQQIAERAGYQVDGVVAQAETGRGRARETR